MASTLTPNQLRTAAATAARKRKKHDRMAAELKAAGWTVAPPDTIDTESNINYLRRIAADAAGRLTEEGDSMTVRVHGVIESLRLALRETEGK